MAPSPADFVWYELLTTDIDSAAAFYGDVLGWRVRESDEGYRIWQRGERIAGGLRELPERARQIGAPPNWLGHVGVPDVEAAAAKATELGATRLGPSHEQPGVGRFVLLRDPQGAILSVCEPTCQPATGVGWHLLNTTDRDAALAYYGALFGWAEGADRAFMDTARQPHIHTHWLYYRDADDLEAALEQVRAGGGTVAAGPMQLGDAKIAVCEDPQGAAFALRQGFEPATFAL